MRQLREGFGVLESGSFVEEKKQLISRFIDHENNRYLQLY